MVIKGDKVTMRFHQNNIFKNSQAVWKRFMRTDYMTLGFIDVDSEMIQPDRFWVMVEDKNYRKPTGDRGDAFQTQIMEERCQASKLPFLGLLTVNKNEQSPFVFVQQSKVIQVVTNVEEPEEYEGLPIDIVLFKWLDINKLFESDEERMEFIKQYNNNVLSFVTSEAYKELQTPTFHSSIERMVTDWGINNKVWSQHEVENGRIKGLVDDVCERFNSFCSNDLKRAFILDEYTKKATFEQGAGLDENAYLLNRNGEIVIKAVEEIIKMKK